MSVHLFKDPGGAVLVLRWFEQLPSTVQQKILVRIERLERIGWELREPEVRIRSERLREIRVRDRGACHRIAFFFHGRRRAVLSHGFVEERDPRPEEWAFLERRRRAFLRDPLRHVFAASIPGPGGECATRSALTILSHRIRGERGEGIAGEASLVLRRESAELARRFHALRTAAGLSRGELTRRLGAPAGLLRGIEEDDFEGLSLEWLRRAARALGSRLELGLAAPPETGVRRPAEPAHAARGAGAPGPGDPFGVLSAGAEPARSRPQGGLSRGARVSAPASAPPPSWG